MIVTISESVEYDLQNPGLAEAFHAKEVGSTDWSTAMRDLADNFYDYNNFGYDKVHGNGVLLLDNAYEGQREAGCLPVEMSMIILAITRSTRPCTQWMIT